MRCAAVAGLLRLYSTPSNVSPLHEFTQRFRQRIAELARDVDDTVAAAGVRLLAHLVATQELPAEQVLCPALQGCFECCTSSVCLRQL